MQQNTQNDTRSKTEKILDFLEDKALDIEGLFALWVNLTPTMTVPKILRAIKKQDYLRVLGKEQRSERRRLQRMISKLKTDGLLTDKYEDSSRVLAITKKGLEQIKNRINKINKKTYKNQIKAIGQQNEVIIVSYDIPERLKKERGILRELLKIFSFKMVHKSVWVGKVKLPEEFIEDLKRMKVYEHVEILKVTKSGSLQTF